METNLTRPYCHGSVAIALRDQKLWRVRWLKEFLGCPLTIGERPGAHVQAWAGWGYKKSGMRAARMASKRGLACWRIEDGFLRSVGLGNRDHALSLIIDTAGMYYDASGPSLFESFVVRSLSPAESARAHGLIAAWRAGRVSKYNHLPESPSRPGPQPAAEMEMKGTGNAGEGESKNPYVLVADQTLGDASVRYGLAGPESFQRMLQAALDEYPDCIALVKIHPDVSSGRKKGYFDVTALDRMPRVQVLAEDVHPVRLIEQARAVYTVTSQIGFEGLLWGKPVRTFGMPFYAGWGLTLDELPAPKRRRKVSIDRLVHAALVDYPRYVNPETGKPCEVEDVLSHIALQRRMRGRFPREVYAIGFSLWRKWILADFLQGSQVRAVRRMEQVPVAATLVVWGRKTEEDGGDVGRSPGNPETHNADAPPQKRKVIRLEDGFLRSVGLGADLVRPLSWVMDERGIYYDATRPSDLEHLLQCNQFTPETVERARNLRRQIVQHGLTKYNVGVQDWRRPDLPDRRVILVPGQVETDASIRFGAPKIKSNLDLLRTVREAHPEAYVLYKPHPDVVAGLRKTGAREEDAGRWCDEIVVDVAMHALIDAVDEVHVLTSLTGFEALLRGKKVVTYGQPFYAGWGLTCDHVPVERRTRKLSLDELVAGVLIEYPTYVSRASRRYTTPERALVELLEWRRASAPGLPWWRKGLRWVLQWQKN